MEGLFTMAKNVRLKRRMCVVVRNKGKIMILLKILKSSNRSVYFSLAKKHHTTVWKVYKLAHGKKVRLTSTTIDILNELKALNIIENIRI